MKIELTEQDILNTVEFLSRSPIKGAESFVMAILIQTYKVALQTSTPEVVEEPPLASENGAAPGAPEEKKAKK